MEVAESLAALDRMHDAVGAFYAGGDADAVREVLTEEVEWHVPGGSPIAGDYYGLEEVLGYFRERRDLANATFRMHPGEVLVGEQHVGVITDGSATIGGREQHWTTLGLYRIDKGRVAACWLLPLHPATFDAIWSSAR